MFRINDNVFIKRKPDIKGIIVHIKDIGGKKYYTVKIDDYEEFYAESDLKIYKTEYTSIEEKVKNNISIPFDDFKRNLLFAKIQYNLSGIFFENSSSADFLPYQFRPLMKILDSDTGRLLIADEVGVGKTIEAGYILSELLARDEIHSVLVVCPKNLVPKWIFELKRFFNEKLERVENSKDLILKFQNRAKYPKLVVGLELIRRNEIVDQLAQGLINKEGLNLQEFETFDLIIFDEAHHLRNTTTLSHRIARILLENCEYSLFLTATPINLSINDLFNLLNLLVYQGELTLTEFNEIMEPNRSLIKIQNYLDVGNIDCIKLIEEELRFLSNGNSFSKLIYGRILTDGNLFRYLKDERFRTPDILSKIKHYLEKINFLSTILNNTRKRDIVDHENLFPVRHPEEPILLTFTGIEKEFYSKARSFFIQLIVRRAEGFVPIHLVEIMPQRVIASSIHGTFNKLRRMLETHRMALEYEDEDFQDESQTDSILLQNNEIEEINQLLDYEELIGPTDSKFNAVLEKIREYFIAGNEQIIIFSYFKSTIEYITRRLNETDFSREENIFGRPIRAEYIHGDIELDQRENLFNLFEKNQIQILVLSEIGAEGIDLQFCNCLINYDLPWNPMKLEQRIGRLDRYGQKKPIFITNVYIRNSIEDRILHRLYQRIEIVRENLIFLNPILEEYFSRRRELLYHPERTEDELEEIVNKLEENLARKKLDMEKIEERLDEIKGNTGKTLIFEEKFINDKRNPFSLKELFEALNFLLKTNFSGTFLEKCEKNDSISNYLTKKGIPNSPRLYYLITSENLITKLQAIELKPESINENLRSFIYRIDSSLNSKKRRYKPILVTYDVELASDFSNDIDLLSLKHILAKVLIKLFKEKNSIKFSQNTLLRPLNGAPFNSILLRIFLLRSEGIQKESRIEVIGYHLDSEEIVEHDIANYLFEQISIDKFELATKHQFKPELIDKAFDQCFLEIISIKEQLIKEQKIRMEQLYKYKREQINHRYDNKIDNLRKTLEKVKGKKIERLYEGQISKNINRKKNALEALDIKYNKEISVSIIDIGAILIGKKEADEL